MKNELCKISRPFDESSIKLLYGLLLFSRSFKVSEISFYTENKNIAELICDLILQNFGCIVDVVSSSGTKENLILKIPFEQNRKEILKKHLHFCSFSVIITKLDVKNDF